MKSFKKSTFPGSSGDLTRWLEIYDKTIDHDECFLEEQSPVDELDQLRVRAWTSEKGYTYISARWNKGVLSPVVTDVLQHILGLQRPGKHGGQILWTDNWWSRITDRIHPHVRQVTTCSFMYQLHYLHQAVMLRPSKKKAQIMKGDLDPLADAFAEDVPPYLKSFGEAGVYTKFRKEVLEWISLLGRSKD